jgi:hypothetical protein
MSKIFIPAGVRDKAMRDTLIAIVRELDTTKGKVTVSYDDPGAGTPGAKGDVIYAESSNSIWVFSDDNNWVLAAGVSTAHGAEGYTGVEKFTGTLYYQTIQSSQPNAPTAATWSIPNNDFLSITPSNAWSHRQPPVNITDTAFREWSTNYTITLDPTTTPIGVSITFSTPTGAIQVTDDIESDNYVAGSSGWAIRRDDGYAEFGSAAIRGTLSADQIGVNSLSAITANMGSLTAGTISSSAGNMTLDLSAGTLIVRDANNNIRVKLGNI